MLKWIRAPLALLHAAPQEVQCKDLQTALKAYTDQMGLPADLDAFSASNTTQHFCKRCKEFDLPDMLRAETKSPHIRLLKQFDDPLCQLCETIQHFVKLHWDHEMPSAVKGRGPRVYVETKRWCSISDSSGLTKCVCRIVLALDQPPPDLQPLSQSMLYNNGAKFVLTELEIDPTRTKQTSMLTSVRRPILPCVDPALVQRWLDNCRNHHDYCRDNRASQLANTTQRFFSDGFRLIDVIDGRLVLQKKPCEYVALSYVWGQAASFNLCTNNENLLDLCQPSSLYKPYNEHGVCRRLPRTIADAMSLCRSIGQRYLWVDSLCIVQDDVEEKRRLIHGMNRVYENANLTLLHYPGLMLMQVWRASVLVDLE
jgi:hypothetical protein